MKYLVLLLSFVVSSYGQHFSASIGKAGLSKVITSAIETYSESQSVPTYVIPASKSHLTLSKEEINSYAFVNEIKKYVNIDLSKDFHYYLKWSPMTVEFKLKEGAYEFDFKGDSSDFTIFAKGVVESVRVYGDRFEICETKNKKCIKSNGAYIDIRNFEINLNQGEFVDALVALNIKNTDEVAKVSNTGLYSSLFTPNSRKGKNLHSKFNISSRKPNMDINFEQIIIPAPTLRVGNREVKLDTSGLRKAIISQKKFLASNLLHIVGKFITEDLSKLVTSGIIGDLTEITKKINIFKFAPDVIIGPRQNSGYGSYVFQNSYEPEPNVSSELMAMVMDMVYYSNIDLEYLTLRPNANQTITFDYDMNIELNNSKVIAKKTILNGGALFTAPKFPELKKDYDLAIAISEPFLNGIFKTAVDTGVVRKIFRETAPVKGLKVNSLNIHFDQSIDLKLNDTKKPSYSYDMHTVAIDNTRVAYKKPLFEQKRKLLKKSTSYNTGTFTLVAGVELDLSKVDSKGLGARLKNYIASTLESKKVWFPLELRFRPLIRKVDGRVYLNLHFDKSSQGELISNRYRYPKKNMYEMVEKGVLATIKKDLFPALEKEISIDVTDYISIEGLKARPIDVQFLKSGHMALLLDVESIGLKDLVDYIGGN